MARRLFCDISPTCYKISEKKEDFDLIEKIENAKMDRGTSKRVLLIRIKENFLCGECMHF